MLAWRDLDDPEAGGSERHAHQVASLWAGAGLDVTLRTSAAAGHPSPVRARRLPRGAQGRPLRRVPPQRARAGSCGRRGRPDGLVEIWNGMPFFSPLWARCPRIVFLHHVHAEMWQMVLRPLASPGPARSSSAGWRPPLYRRHAHRHPVGVVAPARSSTMLGLRRRRVSVVPPGVDPRFSPGGGRAADPLVVAVGRLVPVKRFDLLIDALVDVRRHGSRPAGGDRGRGLRAARARGPVAGRRRRRMDRASRAPGRRRPARRSTGGPGCWPARRSARGGG